MHAQRSPTLRARTGGLHGAALCAFVGAGDVVEYERRPREPVGVEPAGTEPPAPAARRADVEAVGGDQQRDGLSARLGQVDRTGDLGEPGVDRTAGSMCAVALESRVCSCHRPPPCRTGRRPGVSVVAGGIGAVRVVMVAAPVLRCHPDPVSVGSGPTTPLGATWELAGSRARFPVSSPRPYSRRAERPRRHSQRPHSHLPVTIQRPPA
jgi:hypothetical protein